MGKTRRTGQRIGIAIKREDAHTWRATLRIDGKEAGTFYGGDELETLRRVAHHIMALEDAQAVPS